MPSIADSAGRIAPVIELRQQLINKSPSVADDATLMQSADATRTKYYSDYRASIIAAWGEVVEVRS